MNSIVDVYEDPFNVDLTNRVYDNPDCGYTTSKLKYIKNVFDTYNYFRKENKKYNLHVNILNQISIFGTLKNLKYFKYFALMPNFIKDNKTYTVRTHMLISLKCLKNYHNAALYTIEKCEYGYKVRLIDDVK
jgi:hypothetical protein